MKNQQQSVTNKTKRSDSKLKDRQYSAQIELTKLELNQFNLPQFEKDFAKIFKEK